MKPSKTIMPRLGKVEAVQVHHLGPRRHEVLHELLLRVGAAVDLRDGPQLGVGAEDEVDARAGPLDLARLAVAPFEHLPRLRGRLPLDAHVEQVDEEVVGERLGLLGEAPVLRAADVGAQHAHAADEDRHLGRRERKELRPVDQQLLGGNRELAFQVVAEAVGDRL